MAIDTEDTQALLRKFIAAKDQVEIIKKHNDSDEYRAAEEAMNEIGRLINECNESIKKILAKENVENISIFIAPKSTNTNGQKKTARNGTLMRFLVPHTGKIIETRGHNTKELKELKKEYGSETVMGWRI